MKGICFIEPLFNKVVAGEKTQTRRIINHFGNKEHYGKLLCHWGLSHPPYLSEAGEWRWELQTDVDESGEFMIKPKYKHGEVVYLKEPYVIAKSGRVFRKYDNSDCSYLRFLGENPEVKGAWNNKLFMPESAARYFIKITGVRAERLQDISEADCLKEGIIADHWLRPDGRVQKRFIAFQAEKSWRISSDIIEECPIKAYAKLIDRIDGKGIWESNPFVWVYDFELVDKP
ncbi:MAG: hypothetical protein WC833_08765 [Bacteroidales bacterium]|jgi:hypothetical protein